MSLHANFKLKLSKLQLNRNKLSERKLLRGIATDKPYLFILYVYLFW